MSSIFDQIYGESAAPVLLDTVGESVTYTPKNDENAAASVTAIVSQEIQEQADEGDTELFRLVREFTFDVADVSAPEYGDQITFGTDIYVVRRIENMGGTLIRVQGRKQFGNTKAYAGPSARRT